MLAVGIAQQPSTLHSSLPVGLLGGGPGNTVADFCPARAKHVLTSPTNFQTSTLGTQQYTKNEPDITCGICFDVDGVLAHGTRPIPCAPEAIGRLVDDEGHFRVPVSFVTNSLSSKADKAAKLSELLSVKVRPEQMILAPGPLELFTNLHDKFCLVVGQGKVMEIAAELGFKKTCGIKEISELFPLLDVADHENRKRNEAIFDFVEPLFPKIEAVVLLGEPNRWESALQLLIDVLLTGGRPNGPRLPVHEAKIPVIACNMDLEFKDRANTPRFGHGAFLVCLESLYKKLTGQDLEYEALVGKPSEITFRFAEHVLNEERKRLGIKKPLQRMFLIGDTPDVDIAGSNLYQSHIDRRVQARHQKSDASGKPILSSSDHSKRSCLTNQEQSEQHSQKDLHIPSSRNFPGTVKLEDHSITSIHSILVCTGVYRPPAASEPHVNHAPVSHHHGHRDFPHSPPLMIPTKICTDVMEAIDFIFEQENL